MHPIRKKMSASIPIYYEVYPGDSARWFPSIASLIYVKPELYQKWKLDESSVNFEDVLVDPSDPVKFLWTSFSRNKGFIESDQVPQSELKQWYHPYDIMSIAKKTAQKGYDFSKYLARALGQ